MGFIHADALARSANAFHVVFSRDPHLAAMGLFCPPLPSFVQISLMPLVRPFGSQGLVLAGVAVSAAFAAGHLPFGGMGSIPQKLVLAAERAANLSPAYVIAAIALGVVALWKRDRIAWILLLGALSVPAFHAFRVFTGRLGTYTRYWIDFVPWAIPMLGYLVALAARGRRRPLTRNGARLAAVALLALSTVTTARWMYAPPPEFGSNFYDINELCVTHFWFGGDRLDQLREATKKLTELNDVAAFLDFDRPVAWSPDHPAARRPRTGGHDQ